VVEESEILQPSSRLAKGFGSSDSL
jgi:hypothetical protein